MVDAESFGPERERRELPEAMRNIPLNHVSSGGLMLLDRQGDLVRPAAPAQTDAVALDPRVGPNIRLGDDPAQLPSNMRAQAEPHIVRSPINSNFLVGIFQEGRSTTSGSVDCGYSISTDGGMNWTRALVPNLTIASGGIYPRASDPVAGVDLNGNIYFNTLGLTESTNVILMSRSTDGGNTFGNPTVLYSPPTSGFLPDKPWMAINTFAGSATAGRILATFTLLASNGDSAIQRMYSDNGGISWSPIQLINSQATKAQGSQPLFLPNGNAVIIYWNFGIASRPGPRIDASISTDGGVTFGSPKTVALTNEYVEPSVRSGTWSPSAVADRTNGYVYVVYQTQFTGNPKIAFTKSSDGGNTWSSPIAISDNPAGSGVFNPAINVSPDGQRVTVIYYDHRDNPGSNVLVNLYLAQSFNGGATWEPSIRVSSMTTDASLAPLTSQGYMLGDYQAIAESPNVNVPAVPIWIDGRTGNPDPFAARITIAPATPTPTPNPAQNLVSNGDFETGPFDTLTVTGWTLSGGGKVEAKMEGATTPSHSAALGTGGNPPGNILSQSFATMPGRMYALDFDASVFGVHSGAALQISVQVLGNGTLVNQTITPPEAGTYTPAQMTFQHYHYVFTSNSATTTLQFQDIGSGGGGADAVVDTVSVIPLAVSFQQWQMAHFTSGQQADPSISGWNADPDHDRIANGLEYFFNTDPLTGIPTAESDSLPRVSITTDGSSKYLTLTYRRRIGWDGNPEVIGVADNFGGWDNTQAQIEQVGNPVPNPDQTTETVTVRLKTPINQGPLPVKFLRLSLTQ